MGAIRKQAEAFVETEVDGEVLIVDMAGGELFAMDGTARALWRLIDGTRDEAALVAAMKARYDGPDGAIAGDCAALLDDLELAGLIAR